MKRFRKLVTWLGTASLGLLLLNVAGIVGFHFVRMVENEPFQDPVRVTAIEAEQIKLVDGRSIWPPGGVDERFRDSITQAGFQIDIEVDSESQYVTVIGKRRNFICGTSMPLINIPIIARDVPAYSRVAIGGGRFQSYAELNGMQISECRTLNPEP